jgi:hypothetical protein
MAPLRNTRRERFCLALAEGKSATDAYTEAGYKPCRKNAARLTTNDDIQCRVAEIQTAAAKKTEVTIESLLSELEEARHKASTLDQMSAAVKAIGEKARISGLLVQRVEVSNNAERFRGDLTNEVAEAVLYDCFTHLYPYQHLIQSEDVQAAVAAFKRLRIELKDIVATIENRHPTRQGDGYYAELERKRLERKQLELRETN